MKTAALGSLLALLPIATAEPATVRYELTATRSTVNLSGNGSVDFALLLNGGIPGPVLEFTEGDEAEIEVRNAIPGEDLSVHWHGLLLPPEMDGVPYVNTPPIPSGESFTFRFPVRQSGTYWYHSHTHVQEQRGAYGAIVIRPAAPAEAHDHDVVVVLGDWSDERADAILANLRKDGDYYQHKKGTVRSWVGAARAGALRAQVAGEWSRMGGMDLSDVGYDAFLVNGSRDARLADAHPGEAVRLRIVNASASTYFRVAWAGGPMTVIAADGIDVEPVIARELLLGMGETLDAVVRIPGHRSYELRATAQDGTGFASGWIGMGERTEVPAGLDGLDVAPSAAVGAHAHHGHGTGHSPMTPSGNGAAPAAIGTLTVDDLRATRATAFDDSSRVHDLTLTLDGDMSRYVWHLNGKTIREEPSLRVAEGDVVRVTLENRTMMHHPMHLHGHFFRVLNGGGERAPLKHTVDVPPHGSRVIELRADEPGEWMLHCHNLYHLKSGMARIVEYEGYAPSPRIAGIRHHDPHRKEHWSLGGAAEGTTLSGEILLQASRTRDEVSLRAEIRREDDGQGEGDARYRRFLTRNLSAFAGARSDGGREAVMIGGSYLLPLLIHSEAFIDHRGDLGLDLEKTFPWTRRVFTDAGIDLRTGEAAEWNVSLMYAQSWSWAGGLVLTEEGAGIGARLRF